MKLQVGSLVEHIHVKGLPLKVEEICGGFVYVRTLGGNNLLMFKQSDLIPVHRRDVVEVKN